MPSVEEFQNIEPYKSLRNSLVTQPRTRSSILQSQVSINRGIRYIELDDIKEQETVEEYFLANIKYVLQVNNDAQAIRFMEKYYETKKEQEGFHTDEDVINSLHSLELKHNKNYSRIHEEMKKWLAKSKTK